MNTTAALQPVEFLSLLSDSIRWQILSALARSDCRVQELADRVDRPMNLVSYHLGKLRRMKLVSERRSDADSRDVYYSLDLERLKALYREAGEALHPGIVLTEEKPEVPCATPRQIRARVLFLCTENSARSQMAEGLLRHMSRGEVEAVSAGSHPTQVHPLAVEVLAGLGIDISRHCSKSLDEFVGEPFDYIVTVCDRVREVCPAFPGDPERIHWSFADPAAVEGPTGRKREAFLQTATELRTMIGYLLILIEKNGRRAG